MMRELILIFTMYQVKADQRGGKERDTVSHEIGEKERGSSFKGAERRRGR